MIVSPSGVLRWLMTVWNCQDLQWPGSSTRLVAPSLRYPQVRGTSYRSRRAHILELYLGAHFGSRPFQGLRTDHTHGRPRHDRWVCSLVHQSRIENTSNDECYRYLSLVF